MAIMLPRHLTWHKEMMPARWDIGVWLSMAASCIGLASSQAQPLQPDLTLSAQLDMFGRGHALDHRHV